MYYYKNFIPCQIYINPEKYYVGHLIKHVLPARFIFVWHIHEIISHLVSVNYTYL